MRKERIDDAVLRELGGDVLRPAVISAVLHGVFEALRPDVRRADDERLRAELATVEREMSRLSEAIAGGGGLAPLLAALKARQRALQDAIAAVGTIWPAFDRKAVERQVRERLMQWRALLTGHVEDGRELFRQVLRGPIRFRPEPARQEYHFAGEVDLGRLLSGLRALHHVWRPQRERRCLD